MSDLRAVVLVTAPRWADAVLEELRRWGLPAVIVDRLEAVACCSAAAAVVQQEGREVEPVGWVGRLKEILGHQKRPLLVVVGQAGQVERWRQAGADLLLEAPWPAGKVAQWLAGNIAHQGHAPSQTAQSEPPAHRPVGPAIPCGRYRSTVHGRFLEVDQALVEMLGYPSAEELLAVDIARDVYVNPQVRQSIVSVPGDDFHMVEMEWKRKDGRPITVRVSARSIRDERGDVVGFDGIVEDVSRRREMEAQLRAAVVYSPIATVVVDRDGRIVSYNTAAEKLTGYRADEVTTAAEWATKLDAEFSATDKPPVAESSRGGLGPLSPGERPIRRKDGRYRQVQFYISSFPEGHVVQMVDMTEHRQAERAAHRTQQWLRQVIDMHERDRQLMAYELHDGFCQQLSGAMLQLQAYQHLRETNPQEAARCFDAAMGWLGQSINEARRLIGGLRPPILDESGIVAAVDYLVAEVAEGGGIRVLFNQNLGPRRLASPLETCLYRVVQEAVRNARRYSQSDRVQIDLFEEDNEIVLTVQDWGVGFDPKNVARGHFGLEGIRQRAQWLGGTAEITSAPGHGTKITVRLPWLEAPGCGRSL